MSPRCWLQSRIADILGDLEGRVLVPRGERLGYCDLITLLRVVDEAVDLDAIAPYVEPAETLVSRSHTTALQEVMQEHLLIFAPIEGEGWV